MSQTPFGWENDPRRHQRMMNGPGVHGVSAEASTHVHEVPESWPDQATLDEMFKGGHDRLTVLPQPPEPVQPYRPTLATRILRNVCYVVVILTCLYFAYTLFEVNAFINDVQQALREWSESFTTNLLGD